MPSKVCAGTRSPANAACEHFAQSSRERPPAVVSPDTPADLPHGVVVVMSSQVWAGAEVRKSHSWHIHAFDAGDATALAEATGIGFLGALPLDGEVCEGGDAGAPFVLDGPMTRDWFLAYVELGEAARLVVMGGDAPIGLDQLIAGAIGRPEIGADAEIGAQIDRDRPGLIQDGQLR